MYNMGPTHPTCGSPYSSSSQAHSEEQPTFAGAGVAGNCNAEGGHMILSPAKSWLSSLNNLLQKKVRLITL